MSKKGLKTMLVCIVLLIGLVTLFACNKNDVADKDGQTKVIVKIQDEDGSIYKENVVFSDLFTLSLQKEGYTGRLYRDADFLKPLTKDSKVKNGDTVYVKWTINKYTVTFMDGETVLKAYTNVQHGDTVTAPEVPKKDGKTFSKWDKGFSNVTSDLTINAVYDVDTFTVTFKDGEKVLETQTVEYEAAATAPDIAPLSPPEGMHFAKWDKDFSKVTEDIEVSAVYELNVYKVTFKNGETTLKTEMVKHGSAATPPNVYDTATKKFVRWDKPFDNVTSDLIVNAKFETKKFTLTFIDHNDQEIHKKVLEWGAPVEEEYNAAEDKISIAAPFGYVGWYDNSDTKKTIIEDFSELKMPTHDLTLVLKVELTDSAIGEFKVENPKNFTYSENNSAKFIISGKTYDGVTYKYEWTILKDNEVYRTETTTDEQSLTLQNLDAGKYFAKVRIVASMENCGSVEKVFSADKTLTVSRADISGIEVTGGTFTYGDENAKIKIDGLKDGDVVTYGTDNTNFPLQNVDLSALDCGKYDYFVRVNRGDNYNPYTSDIITVTINKAKVTVVVTPTADNVTLTYGNNLPSLTATINGETYTIESGKYTLQLKDSMQAITGSVANNVGTYNIENVNISVLREKYPEKNYNITVETVGTITINKADLTVTIDKINPLTYGDELPKINYTFSELKLSDKESDFTVSVDTKYKKKADADDYTLTAKVSGDKTNFYNITVNTVEFTVKQKDATITINPIDNIIYGDKVPVLKATVKGVLDGDSLAYTLEPGYTVGAKPGNYNVKVVFDKNAEANKNYAITTTGRTFNVGTKALEIKLDSNVSVGNVAKTYTVEVGSQDLVIGELATGDVIEGSVSITSSEGGTFVDDKAFQKNIVIKNAAGEVVTAYYEIKYNLKVVFVKYDFEINADDKTVTYNGAPQNVDLVTWDASKTYKVTYGTAANECNAESLRELNFINAGTYTIYFKVVDTANGAEEKGSVKFTISPAKVTIKVEDVTITYGETPAYSHTVTGLVDGETLSGEAVYSGAGTDAGEYKISVSGLSAGDNYTVTVVPGKLTINKKPATVTWTIAESYVYNPEGQTSLPTATYDDKEAILKFTKDGIECEFKDAGEYTVTVKDDKNYDLTGGDTTKTIVIEKAEYTTAPALSLTGTYDPNKTLGSYELSEGFTWADADEVPVCTKTEYAAKYNMDPANYNDLDVTVTLTLQKATVTLTQNLFEFNYDGASREIGIGTTVRYNNIEVTEPYTLTFEKKEFSAAGTHRTLVTMEADNYDLPKNTYVYVKVKGVKVGNTYYTIEEALAFAASGQTIFVLNDTAFATQEIAGVLYDDVKFRTVETGVTLLLPFNENDTVGHIGAGDEKSDNYKATAALTGTAKLYKTLVIPEGIEVIVKGKLVVGAQTGKIDAGQKQNAVSGNYCEISLGGTITLIDDATLEVYGYIKGNGEIIANDSTVIENLYLSGWMGGTQSAVRYIGTQNISSFELMDEKTMPIKNPKMFPFSQYELRAIQSRVIINKGSKLQGYTKIATSKLEKKILGITITIPAQVNEATLTFVSSDESNAASGLFRLVGNNSKIIKSMNGDRVKIDLFGDIKDGYTAVSVKVVKATVEMSSKEVFFPIDGRTDITLKNGATFTQSYMFKALPGATITVESGGIYNLNGTLIMYDKSFTDISTYPYPGASRGDAKLIVNGTMNVNGALGGNVTSDNAGAVAVGANATISGVHSAEGEGTMSIGATTKFTFNDTCGVTKSLVFVNADNSTVAAETDRTYNYNNGTWTWQ